MTRFEIKKLPDEPGSGLFCKVCGRRDHDWSGATDKELADHAVDLDCWSCDRVVTALGGHHEILDILLGMIDKRFESIRADLATQTPE